MRATRHVGAKAWRRRTRVRGAGLRAASCHELAAALPDDFPKHLRTLRRDLEALEAGGYPVLTERIDGQTRWRLPDGARAPAIGFSPTELMALAVSRDLLRPLEGTAIRSALDSAVSPPPPPVPRLNLEDYRERADRAGELSSRAMRGGEHEAATGSAVPLPSASVLAPLPSEHQTVRVGDGSPRVRGRIAGRSPLEVARIVSLLTAAGRARRRPQRGCP